MSKESKLNIAYQHFKSNPLVSASFEQLYDAAKPIWELHRSIVRRYTGFDDSDARAIFDDAIFTLSHSKKIHNCFEKALNSRLHSRRVDLKRKGRKLYRNTSLESLLDEAQEEGTGIPKALRSEYVLEDDVLRKTEADQLELIDFLRRSWNSDATTTGIVEAMLNAPLSATRNEIAKGIGVHHEVVKRKLRALSRYYDANRFGDYRDYLSA